MKSRLVRLLFLLQLTLLRATAQESPAPAMKTGPPSPEMQKLFEAFSGTWSITQNLEPSEAMPKGGTGHGEEVYRSGPGGASMIEEVHVKGESGEISGLSVTWWDEKAQGYKALWCASNKPSGCVMMAKVAKWEGSDFVLGDEFEKNGKKFVFKEVISEITSASFTQTIYQGEAGKELKRLLTIHATRPRK